MTSFRLLRWELLKLETVGSEFYIASEMYLYYWLSSGRVET